MSEKLLFSLFCLLGDDRMTSEGEEIVFCFWVSFGDECVEDVLSRKSHQSNEGKERSILSSLMSCWDVVVGLFLVKRSLFIEVLWGKYLSFA